MDSTRLRSYAVLTGYAYPPMLSRRTSALHAHRWSQPAMVFFVTCCTEGRREGLTASPGANTVCDLVAASDGERDTSTYAFTVMPDHVHWLFALGARLSLGRVIARLKAKSRIAMAAAGIEWQRDFFEHRLRIEEAIEPYGLYVFLNPYRASLIQTDEVWPYWRCPRPEEFRFISVLGPEGTPPPEWVGEPIPNDLVTGEWGQGRL